jgi:phospholipid/cholesterol/gamma-HCH transport system permease protein
MLSHAIAPISFLGKLSIFIWNSFLGLKQIHRRTGQFLQHFDFIGVQSLVVVTFSAIFIGAVLAFQTYVALHFFGMDGFLGASVGIALMRELAPVFCGIMVAGRAGAAIAAEIATMRVTEQIDAMEALGTDPHDYLMTPRILAGTIALPLLCIYFTILGCSAGWFIAAVVLDTDGAVYWHQLSWAVDFNDVWQGLTKAVIFGFFLSVLGCFYGYHADNNAEGVGVATNRAVVTTALWILFSDYVLTAYLPYDPSYLIL